MVSFVSEWKECTIDDLGEVVGGATPSTKKPENYEQMLELAELLSADYPHVRVDLYNIAGKIYFGELTFFPASGLTPFEPREWDNILGEYLKLPLDISI